jgi:hypothetical protein
VPGEKAQTRNKENSYLKSWVLLIGKEIAVDAFVVRKNEKHLSGEGPVSSESARGASAHWVSEQLE